LVKLFRRYRHEGRDLYWEVVSKIAEKLAAGRVYFFLEETSADLANDPLIDLGVDRVDGILNYCVELGLLERESGTNRIGCPKILYRLNNRMIKNPQVKEMIRESQKSKPEGGVRTGYVPRTSTKKDDQDEKEKKERLEAVLGRQVTDRELAQLNLSVVEGSNEATA
jgi:hypothetical protein